MGLNIMSNYFQKNDIIVNPKNGDYFLVIDIKSINHDEKNVTCLAIENIKTHEIAMICDKQLIDYYIKDSDVGDCNCCEHLYNGCPLSNDAGKCPIEKGYSFKYVKNCFEKMLLQNICTLLEIEYKNIYSEIEKLVTRNKKLNNIFKQLVIDELETKDADIVIEHFSKKLTC